MFCIHSSPLSEVSSAKSLENNPLELSVIGPKAASLKPKLNIEDAKNHLSTVIDNSFVSNGYDENVTISKMGKFEKKAGHSIADKRKVSNKENLQDKNTADEPNSIVSETSQVNDSHTAYHLKKSLTASLQEFSNFYDFTPSVRVMLTELGLKPPPDRTLSAEYNSNVSFELASDIPKPLPLRENKILMNKLQKVGSFVPSILTSVNSEQEFRNSTNSRNQQVMEELEKERFRIKHYQSVIEDLQQKILSTEQELALMSSVNEKKSLTIKELVQTLESLAIAWQKLEGSQMKTLKEIEIERDNLKLQLEESSKKIKLLEENLEETKECASDEKVKLLKTQEQHIQEVKQLSFQKLGLEEQLSTSRKALEREILFGEELKKEVLKLQKLLQEEQMSLLQKSSDFDNFKHAIENQLSLEIKKREEKETKLDEIAFQLEAANAEMFSLKEQLDMEKKKKDATEAELRRCKSEFISDELKYKTEMACKIKEVEVRAEEQAKHLEESLNKKHQEEVSHILYEHQQWREEKEAKQLKEIQDYKSEAARKLEEIQKRLEASECETQSLRQRIEQIESGRSQMLSQLHSFLQSMWRNSFQLFYGRCDPSAELFQEEHCLEKYLSVPSSVEEFYSVPKNTRKFLSPFLPLNLTSGLSEECNTENAYISSVKQTGQYQNVSLSKPHLENPAILSKSGENCLTNRDNLIFCEKQTSCDATEPIDHEYRTKLLAGYSQVDCVDKKDSGFPEKLSSVSYISCCQPRENDNELQNKVSSRNMSCQTTDLTDVTVDNHLKQKAKNSVHFFAPCKDTVSCPNHNKEENMLSSDACSERGSSSTEMMKLPPPANCSKHLPPLMIRKMYCHQMPAEKLETHLKPLKKEVVTMNPYSETQNGSVSDKVQEEMLKIKTQTEPPIMQQKASSSGRQEYFKDRKSAKNELPPNYSTKDLRAIYCSETRCDIEKHSTKNPKDWELYNKLHPWK